MQLIIKNYYNLKISIMNEKTNNLYYDIIYMYI